MRRRDFCALAAAPLAAAGTPYLSTVRQFADTLLECGTDRYGAAKHPAWAGVIDTQTWTAPEKDVPAPPGLRAGDRAVGGCNLYHDVTTLRVMLALTRITGDKRYAQAARDYMRWFLEACRSRANGLLAWGEHLYYDFYRDTPAFERRYHELLEWTPPWDLLWEVNPEAVNGAIAGLRYHHFEDRPGTLFNRHAYFDRAEFQKDGQPWIKHTGLYSYSFAFLHARTGDKRWLDWARGDASLYWDRRNPKTNLTLSCIGDPREGSKHAGMGMTLLGYWLRKAALQARADEEFATRALTLTKAWDSAALMPSGTYRSGLLLDATPSSNNTIQPWHFAYGESSILMYGRVAAFFARVDGDEQMRRAAHRVADLARDTPIPHNASVEGLGFAINLCVDLGRLQEARRYADIACDRFWHTQGRRGLFVRLAGDRYYESKTGVGDVLSGLLRLDAAGKGRALDGDWTF